MLLQKNKELEEMAVSVNLTLSKPRAYAQSLHKSIRIYMAIILGVNMLYIKLLRRYISMASKGF